MKSRLISLCMSAVTAIAIGCGGAKSTPLSTASGSSGSTTTQPLRMGMHTGPTGPESGFQVHTASTTTTAMLPGPLRYLASFLQVHPETTSSTTSSSISMSMTGYCPFSGNNTPNVEFLVYGLGELGDPSCTNGSPNDLFPAKQYMGAPVVGSGTLSTLVVYSSTTSVSNTGLVIKVYVNNQPTPLTCTITTGNNKCEDLTDTVAVNDGDYVTATFMFDNAQESTGMSNIRVMLGKQ